MKRVLIDYIIKNKKNFIVILVLFLFGMALGIFFINNTNEIQKEEISNYVQKLLSNIKDSEDINRLDLLLISMKQNIAFIVLIWFLGCTIIGGFLIYIAIIYKGFSLGYTISAMIAVLGIRQGIIVSLITLLLQNLIFLPTFFIIAENRNKII